MAAYSNGLVSVIIPLYNAERYIGETLASVLAQSCRDLEVVDDCSGDGSAAVVESFRAGDSRVRLFRQAQNGGAAAARNRALAEARGRYIAFLDSDDLWAPDKLERQLALMAREDAAFVFSAYDMVDAEGKPLKGKIRIKPRVRYRDLLTQTMIGSSTVLLKRSLIEGYRFPPRKTGQDYALWLRLLRKTDALGVDAALVHYRVRGESLSQSKLQNIRDVWEVQTEQEGISRPAALLHTAGYCLYAAKKRLL